MAKPPEAAKRFVLDAFALMALFQEEPGADRVQRLIRDGNAGRAELYMTTVNLGEVVYGLEMRRGSQAAVTALGAITGSSISLVDADMALALSAADVKASTKMGYLDAFAVALGRRLQAAVVTGDPGFAAAPGDVAVEWLTQR